MSTSDTNPIPEPRNDDPEKYDGVTKRYVTPLLVQRKRNLPRDEHVSEYTHIDENGDKIHRIEYDDEEKGTETIDANLSKLLAAAPSRSSNVEVLRIEAQQAAEASDDELEDMNPHLPSNNDVLDTATDAIESDGNIPAWEVVDGE